MSIPHISINMAITADGKIAANGNIPTKFTSRQDSQRLMQLRQDKDAILVGRKTWQIEQMTMLVNNTNNKLPRRCIVGRNHNWQTQHPIFQTEAGDIDLVAINSKKIAVPTALTSLSKIYYHQFLSIREYLAYLYQQGCRTVHCEGGGNFLYSLWQQVPVSTLYITLSNQLFVGNSEAPSLSGIANFPFSNELQYHLSNIIPCPSLHEVYLTYQLKK